jgi:hypothetical protein
MPSFIRSSSPIALLVAAVALAACGRDPMGIDAAARRSPAAPHLLLGPGESTRMLVDSTDAAGNHVMVAEYAAGVYTQPDGTSGSVASITIRTLIPASLGGSSSRACITSTILGVETTAGWTASVKKPGGCDKEIGVEFANAATRQKAVFSFLYIAGKTRIDFGAVR